MNKISLLIELIFPTIYIVIMYMQAYPNQLYNDWHLFYIFTATIWYFYFYLGYKVYLSIGKRYTVTCIIVIRLFFIILYYLWQ